MTFVIRKDVVARCFKNPNAYSALTSLEKLFYSGEPFFIIHKLVTEIANQHYPEGTAKVRKDINNNIYINIVDKTLNEIVNETIPQEVATTLNSLGALRIVRERVCNTIDKGHEIIKEVTWLIELRCEVETLVNNQLNKYKEREKHETEYHNTD